MGDLGVELISFIQVLFISVGAACEAVSKISAKPLPESSLCSKSSKLFRYQALSTYKNLCLVFPCVLEFCHVPWELRYYRNGAPLSIGSRCPQRALQPAPSACMLQPQTRKLLYKGLHFQILYLISSELTVKYNKIPKNFCSLMENAALVTKCGFREPMFIAVSQKLELLN